MSVLSDLLERARALLFPGRRERELDEEIRFHIEREMEEQLRRGADPEQARRSSQLAFGSIEVVKESVRDATGIRPLHDLFGDFRYALRSLWRDPVYTAASIVVLSVALGAAATVFSVLHSVVFAPLPYPEPERLVRVGQLYQQQSTVWQLSTVDAQAIVEQQRSFEAFGLVARSDAALSGAGAPVTIPVARVTSGFFEALRVGAEVGRLIVPDDERADAPPVVVVSRALADERFGGPQAALGRPLLLDGLSHTVVGILGPGVRELAGLRATAWPALKLRPPERRGPFWLRGFGRLREGVSLEAAARDMHSISDRIYPLWASSFPDRTARIAPVLLQESIVGDASRSIALFGASVGLVLLVAIVNVATLSLARASARAPELSLRVTLGAGRVRLGRLPLAEGLTLGTAAGGLALGLAEAALGVLPSVAPSLPRIHEVTLSGSSLLFLAAASLASGALVSTSPILAALRGFHAPSVHGDRRRTGADRRATRLRSALVVAEFALALPLLLGAGLLFRSFLLLQRVNPGFDPAGIVAVTLSLPDSRYPGYEEKLRFWRQLQMRAQDRFGASAAGITSTLPPDDAGDINNFDLLDRPVAPGVAEHLAPWSFVTPGAFDALGVDLLEGRMFTDADSGDAPEVVLVSRAWAERYYPGESAVGRQMVAGGCTTCPPTTVVGVVSDVKYLGLAESADAVYSPLAQSQIRTGSLLVHTGEAPGAAFREIRELVSALDPDLPVEEQTMAERIARALSGPGRSTAVLSGFAVTAVLLAALAIFGLMSYTVRQRRREIGVRVALGANGRTISGMVVRSGMTYATTGTVLGLGITFLEGHWLEAFLFGLAATDPLTTVAAVALLLSVAAIACWVPAFRASRIHPAEAIATD